MESKAAAYWMPPHARGMTAVCGEHFPTSLRAKSGKAPLYDLSVGPRGRRIDQYRMARGSAGAEQRRAEQVVLRQRER